MFCEMVHPKLPWKRRPAHPDIAFDYFGIFSPGAVRRQIERQGQYYSGEDRACNSTQMTKEVAPPDYLNITRETVESLMGVLPEASRNIIKRMLEPLPSKRANFVEIFADDWVKRITCN